MSTKSKVAIILIMLATAIALSYFPALAQNRAPGSKSGAFTPFLGPASSRGNTAQLLADTPVVMGSPEYRISEVFGFGSEYANPTATTKLINTLYDNNFNVVMPEIRKQGDAYYNSAYEPWATDVMGGYDPLADILTQAHAKNIQVFGWIVTYRIWPKGKTAPPTHIWSKHPEWALIDNAGHNYIGSYHNLDPGIPGVEDYIVGVVKDIVTKYPTLDGFNFDYIRYDSTAFGYNAISKARFKSEYGYDPPTGTDTIVDNTSSAATFAGAWTLDNWLYGKYGSNYRYTTTDTSETATTEWRPNLPATSTYDVYVWYPEDYRNSTKAPYTIYYEGGSTTVEVNQQTNGGRWVRIAQALPFTAGTSGYVRLGNGTGETGWTYVMADAVRFVELEHWPAWSEWKRRQITDLVKRCYLEAIYLNPKMKMTADTIGWSGGDPVSDFTSTRAYNDVCQDSKSWMNQHFLDINMLMNYKRDWNTAQSVDYYLWSDYLAQLQTNSGRHCVDTNAGYLNLIDASMAQWQHDRANGLGLSLYRYGYTCLTPNAYGTLVQGKDSDYYNVLKSTMFQNPAPVPDMPWKDNPTTGYLFGQVTDAMEPNDPVYRNWLYNKEVTITNSDGDEFTATTDATGTYGFLDLEPGQYKVSINVSGYQPITDYTVTVTAGRATKADFLLGPIVPDGNNKNIANANDATLTPDNTIIALTGSVVTTATGALSDCIYVEESNKTRGLRIKLGSGSPALMEGDRVNLVGKMATENGERVLSHTSVQSKTASAALTALGSNIRDLSRMPVSTGLLVRVAGKVTDGGLGWFTITDGSGSIKVKCIGLTGMAKGAIAQVTGINALDTTERCIRARKQIDITTATKVAVTSPSGTIGAGLNLFSIPYIPTDQTPSAAFTGLTINGNLFRWNNLTQSFTGYDAATPSVFGNVVPNDGYALISTTNDTLTFEGTQSAAADARISCPVKGWSLISNPFTIPILWDNISVTDGLTVLSLHDAVAAGWIGRIAFTWDNQAQNFGYLGTGARGSRFDDSLRPWKSYWITTYVNNLAVIIPVGG